MVHKQDSDGEAVCVKAVNVGQCVANTAGGQTGLGMW